VEEVSQIQLNIPGGINEASRNNQAVPLLKNFNLSGGALMYLL
jgi:hypothetical protein